MKGRKGMCPLGKKLVIEATKRDMGMRELTDHLGISSYAYLYKIVYGKVGVGPKYAEAIEGFLGEEIVLSSAGRSA